MRLATQAAQRFPPFGRVAAMRLVLTGGGTGGHIYPAIAIAEAFAADASFKPLDVLFVGTHSGLEAQIVPKAMLPIAYVRAAPLVRKVSTALARTVFTNGAGVLQALGILHRARPDVLIATGGYVAFPVVAALRLVRLVGRSRAKIALLEPNAATGLTNRLLAPLVDEIWYAMAPAGRALGAREFVVGTPVRATMRRHVDAAMARKALGIERKLTTIVVMGGSQGAHSLNEAAAGLIELGVPVGWQFVIVAGAREYEALASRLAGRERVRVLSYLDDPRAAYAAADLVVARAGASTLGELAATATPALLVPYPHATDDHQTHNARAFAASGAARVVEDASLDARRLRDELQQSLEPPALHSLRAAARLIALSDPRAAILARVKRWASTNGTYP